MSSLTISDPAFLGVPRVTYRSAVLANTTPAGLWLLNDPSPSGTNQWQDSSGNARHASDLADSLNPTPTASTLNGGLSPVAAFDGSDDRVLIAHDNAFGATSMSVEAWIKVPSSASFWTVVARCATSSANSGSAFYCRVTTTQVQFARFSGSNLTTYSINAAVMDNAWHHVVWAYTSSVYEVIVDGVSAGTTSTSGNLNTPTRAMVLGCDFSSAETNFKAGSLAGVAVHPGTALSAAQVVSHYNAGKP